MRIDVMGDNSIPNRILGKTGLSVSQVSFGCWAIGGPFINLGVDGGWGDVPEEEAKNALLKSVQMGVNLFDTADVYGVGKSERLLGWLIKECLEQGKRREDLVIITKSGLFKGCSPHGYYPLQMRHQIEMSLDNLGIDYIDVLFLHHLDFGPNYKYLENAVNTVNKFRKEGLIRYVGLRGPHHFSFYRNSKDEYNADFKIFSKLAQLIDPEVVTFRYNMFSKTYDQQESDIFSWAEERNIGILIYKPLAQGLLIGSFSSDNPPNFVKGDSRRRKIWFQQSALRVIESKLDIIKSYFNINTKKELVHLCIKYCLSRAKNACVLVGIENEMHAAEAFSVRGLLSREEVHFIQETFIDISDQIDGFGDLYFDNI
jgi:aryl-alcohol dehydrogenase-like predicted oxidoreductase